MGIELHIKNIERLIASERLENAELAINLCMGLDNFQLLFRASSRYVDLWASQKGLETHISRSGIASRIRDVWQADGILPHEAIKKFGKHILGDQLWILPQFLGPNGLGKIKIS